MALNPIRWDNIASPQFNNSGYAVAGEAFGSATDSAAVLAEAFYKKAQDKKAEEIALATNAQIAKGVQDGVIKSNDYGGGPKVDQAALIEAYGAFNIDQRAGNEDTRAAELQADTFKTSALTRQDTQLSIDAQTYAQSPEVRAREAKERNLKFKTDTLEYQNAVRQGKVSQIVLDEHIKTGEVNNTFDNFILGEGPGSYKGMFDEQAQAEASKTPGYDPNNPEHVAATKQHSEQLRAQYEVNNPDHEYTKFLQLGGKAEDFTTRPEGQQRAQRIQIEMQQDADEAARINEKNKNYRDGVEGAYGDKPQYMTVDSNGGMVLDSTAKGGSIGEAKSIASNLNLDITDSKVLKIVNQAHEAYPNLAMFKSRVSKLLVKKEGGFFTDPSTTLIDDAEIVLGKTIVEDKQRVETYKEALDKVSEAPADPAAQFKLKIDSLNSGGKTSESTVTPDIAKLDTEIEKGAASVATIRAALPPEKAEKAVKTNIINLDTDLKEISEWIKTSIPKSINQFSPEYDQLQEYLRKFTERKEPAGPRKMLRGEPYQVPAKPYTTEELQAERSNFDIFRAKLLADDTANKERAAAFLKTQQDDLLLQKLNK